MRIVGQKNGGIVAALAAGAIMAQLGATQVFAETSAHKATASCSGGSTGITLPKGFCATIFADKIGPLERRFDALLDTAADRRRVRSG